VAQVGKGIVFDEKGHLRRGAAFFGGPEGRGHLPEGVLDLQASLPKDVDDLSARPVLPSGNLRVSRQVLAEDHGRFRPTAEVVLQLPPLPAVRHGPP
jgi:hypothetical protein